MKIKLTALLLALLLCCLSGCGEQDQPAETPAGTGERTELYSYAPPAHGSYTMPENPQTEEEFRTAWKAAVTAALEPGGTYNGLHLPEMPVGRLRAELQANGHSPTDTSKVVMEVKEPQYLITARHSNGQPDQQVHSLGIQCFGMDKGTFDRANLEQIHKEMTLSVSKTVLGESVSVLWDTLGITGPMLDWVAGCENDHFSWYEGETAHWSIIWNDEGGRISLALSRSEDGHDQSIQFMGSSGLVSSLVYDEDFKSQEGRDNFAMFARQWHTAQQMPGVWNGIRAESGGQSATPAFGTVYMGFSQDGTGVVNIPGTTNGDMALTWEDVRVEQTETGERVLFRIRLKENGQTVTNLELYYITADGTALLTDQDASFSVTFEKVD